MATYPWDKFFWSDYQGDDALKLCSLAAQGLWMRMLCVCAYSEPKGFLMVNGNPLTVDQMAALFGKPATEIEPLIDELESMGVFSKNKAGNIYNRKMVRNEKKVKTAKENGKKGGNPSLSKQKKNSPSDNQNSHTTSKKTTTDPPGNNQKPEARGQRPEGSQTTTTESNAGRALNERPPEGGGDVLEEDPFEIPGFLDRRGGDDPGPGDGPGPGQELRQRPSLAEQCEPDVPDPDDHDPVAAVKAAYLEARNAVFGTDWLAARPGMAGVDHQGHGTAKRWVDAGATPDIVREVIRTEMAKFKGRGKTYPPNAMHYFDNPISEAIAAAKRPMPTAGDRSGGEDYHPDGERNQWRGRVKGWVERSLWLDNWGPKPGEPRCEAPADILAEFNLSQIKGAAQ